MLHLSFKEKILKNKSGFKGVGNIINNESVPTPDSAWNILKGNVSLPAATLSDSAIKHNSAWLKKFSEKFDFQLAPHGKTTMLPDLFNLQIRSGCWGITLANAAQVAVAYECGVKRVIMANQLVGRANMDIISTILKLDSSFEFFCLVDSSKNVEQLGNFFSKRAQKISVFLEYGPMGGRTGIRDESQERNVLTELRKWKNTISVAGVEFFEGTGILKTEEEIRHFIQKTLSRVPVLNSDFGGQEVIITGAGTSWLDVVAEEFLKFEKSCDIPLKKILRSGCYLIFDEGLYEKMESRVSSMKLGQGSGDHAILSEKLKPAMNIWASVLSLPEPNLAIIGMGRRDVAMDCGYPIPQRHYRSVGTEEDSMTPVEHDANQGLESWDVFHMMDQHTFLRIKENANIEVGDVISFGIYHACTNLDKWKNVLLVDNELHVIDVLQSAF